MKRSTFVKGSVPIIIANGLIAGVAQVSFPMIVTTKGYILETVLSSVILGICTTTLQNHLGDSNSKYISTAIVVSSLFMWLLYIMGSSSYGIFIHILNIIWAMVNYFRVTRH